MLSSVPTITSAQQSAGTTLRGRVMIVDDEPVLRAMTSAMLSMQGWEVLNASNADEAAQLFQYCVNQNRSVDAVIIDLIMPGGPSGVEALGILRNIHPGSRFIASSGFLIGADSHEACLSLGFDDVLPKPYDSEQLQKVMLRNTL